MKDAYIKNGLLVRNGRIAPGAILIRDGKIAEITKSLEDESCLNSIQKSLPKDCRIIDAGGRYVAPGFIDIHVHGGGGYDFMDCTVEAFQAITQVHGNIPTKESLTFKSNWVPLSTMALL